MKRYRLPFLIIALLTALMASSCSSDLHYANAFLRKHKRGRSTATEQIYVCLPKTVLHTNSSLNSVEDFNTLTVTEQDSIIASLTNILNRVNDSIFLAQFSQAMLFTISQTNIPIVIVDDESQLPQASRDTLVLNVVQVEAEEFLERSRSDFYTRNGYYYNYDYDLRHFSTNAWFEFDAPGADTNLYFMNQEVMEDFRGTVVSLKGQQAKLNGTFNRINVNDAYRTARQLGYICGTSYVEQILLDQVKKNKGTNTWYMLYNPSSNDVNVMVDYESGKEYRFTKVQ